MSFLDAQFFFTGSTAVYCYYDDTNLFESKVTLRIEVIR